MQKKHYYLLLAYFESFGSRVVLKLIDKLGSVEKLFTVDESFFYSIKGLKKNKIKKFLEERKNIHFEKIAEDLNKKNIKYLSINQDGYPRLLKNIYDPPLVLFYRGIGLKEKQYPLAVVGTRKSSHYGKKIVKKLLRKFDSRFSIISGMAYGIDAAAHSNAIKNNLYTVAVLGNGVDYIYPPENKKLYEKIIERGTVISEFLPGSKPKKYRFPMRNRIISGLSKGVLVVEGPQNSGSLITARTALSQNRDVFTPPGNIFKPNSRGPHKLLKQGAFVVTKPEDIYEYWKIDKKNKKQKNIDKKFKFDFSGKEKVILEQMNQFKAINVDELFMKLNGKIPLNKLLSELFKLKMKGIVEELPGKKFILEENV
ncbi:MAG: DNA-protecting protein DprA [Candidatus Mcinerneyibacterium aminivorans]|uniref:DNA-protecting protein DprA n=1 Tax=Candidatus Mcinerneyibacterium aminivorans TaxID=2703815 RepID=A0A5D0MBZ0_9BACT|nr:MAG: DNA-protecting protein DprA [Candidatus Mcinerneyibacterium aminivorans]